MFGKSNKAVTGPPPDEAALREAALAHLARFAATEAGLLRVLQRRVQRWAARAKAEAADADGVDEQRKAALDCAASVVRKLAGVGAVDDRAFAQSRTARLTRSGHSRRVIAAHLAARGVDPETAQSALTRDGGDEFGAAVLFARRRRLGPFRSTEAADDTHGRELAAFARAGFPRALAVRVLRMTAEAAADAVLLGRRG